MPQSCIACRLDGGIFHLEMVLQHIGIALEMLVFSGVHLRAGAEDNGPMYYWLAVATVCAVIVLGRLFVAPH